MFTKSNKYDLYCNPKVLSTLLQHCINILIYQEITLIWSPRELKSDLNAQYLIYNRKDK